MELASVNNGVTAASEYGFNADQLRSLKGSVDIDQAKKAYDQVKRNLKNVEGSDKPSQQDIEKIAEQLNSLTASLNIQLRFSVEQRALGIIRIQMIDTNTNEVIREIPPQRIKTEGSNLLDAAGLIINELV
jgi:flagellar protein FlaG